MLFKYAIALTGSISTGKSSAVELLKQTGFHIIDADSVAHQVLDEQHQAIARKFGEELVKEGKVDRKSLGKMIFADKEKRKVLEELLHPLIYARIADESTLLDKRAEPYIVDIPLFFEGGRYAIESVIVVYAKKEQQLKRLIQREAYSEEEALLRINAQIDIEEKRKNATYAIDNSGDLKQLQYETERIREEILGDFS
ncbi:MAG: dephospho-CoA kinase [Sulfurovum sp.]|nr:dephospho-CoA kinase [Sulfurovum sp.]